jgi:integrase/recombinase XerD
MSPNAQQTRLTLVPPVKPSVLQQDVDAFLLDCRARHLTASSLHYYTENLEPFVTYLAEQSVTSVQAIRPPHIRAYLVSLQERGLKDNTQHGVARAIRAWLNFCVNEELIDASPMRKVKMPKLGKEILPAFSPDDVTRLLDACKVSDYPLRDTAIVLCLLDTGCRAAEFAALNVGSVDRKTGTVKIKEGKGRKDRVCFLGAKAGKALWKYLRSRPDDQDTEPLFLSDKTGERLSQRGLACLLDRLGNRAQVEHCHAHTFRRSFALWSLRSGMDLISLSRIMGHTDLAMLRRYLAQVDGDLQAAHAQHGAVDNML